MAVAGLAFGLPAARRPFGEDVFANPIFILFILVGLGLVALRFIIARPVPEIIPERSLVIGCFIGLAAFLAGNWLGTHVLAAY